jgi:tetratricopeptide (TPR) repeat protein
MKRSGLAAIIVLATWLVPCVRAQEPERVPPPPSRTELHSVLVQARNALVEMIPEEGGWSSETMERIQRLSNWLLRYGTRDDLAYLREHWIQDHPEVVRDALEPAAGIGDFAARRARIEADTVDRRHDEDLEYMISQELNLDYFDDAAQTAQSIRSLQGRMRALADVAIAQEQNGQNENALRTVGSAMAAGVASGTRTGDFPPDMRLRWLAYYLHDSGFQAGSRKVLERIRELVQASGESGPYTWRFLASAAAGAGDDDMAIEAASNAGDSVARAQFREERSLAETLKGPLPAALQAAAGIPDPRERSQAFCKLARRESQGGDKVGAEATLQQAEAAADQVEEFRVDALVDVAWARIQTGDREGAEKTLDWALQVNEEPSYGEDQVNGWAGIAESFAFMGEYDRALAVADKIPDHEFKARALEPIAYRQSSAGHVRDALAWATNVKDPEERTGALFGICQAMVEQFERDRQR